MNVFLVQPAEVSEKNPHEVETLLQRDDAFVWVDIPEWDDEAERLLVSTFGCHPLVITSCKERNFVPTVHSYEAHTFVILHVPLAGEAGHVHSLELDQIISGRYLITVHGPRNPAVPLEESTAETRGVLNRMEQGRFRPRSPYELSYAIGSAIARRQSRTVRMVANRLPQLEQQVLGSDFRRPEDLLEQLFLLRHELLIARTMAAQAHDMYVRIDSLERFIAEADRPFARDLSVQFDRVRSVADGESQFLFGVIDLYQTRVTTKMTVAMERLAVIAAITLPVTALASVYGMNVIVNTRTHVVQLVAVLAVMLVISGLLLRWTKKQGWW
ncbi:hypothetical protein GCM10009841_18550 [Microlunatus panaciterrae]|uniref:Mg2+ and Co2+ transporter CorA n=1 Tax=Microlunatus panaciterrae TaxID=400768 RepID=A0ABS2RN23_9ACTN|nr:magnesium transporter CorA family protein [Microlunatus panaciterrae]MBM7800413.1 Mg2+ and Co2+ transporter CorA [Microlunatus panaciterrae]